MKKYHPLPQKFQHGIVLIVAMIMLVIMTILGVSSVRNIALEEWMSASLHDRSIAIQAAEAALLAGEQDAQNRTDMAGFDPEATLINGVPAVVNGFAAQPTTQAPNWMLNAQWNDNSRQLADTVNLGALAGTRPRYLIEYRGKAACKPPPNPKEAARNDCNPPAGSPIPATCDCYLFRITARSNPGANRAEVILQSLVTVF